jgi:hypothetical protein
MKPKRKKKSPRKGRRSKILFLLILIGICLSMVYLIHQEIFNSLKPWLEKWKILEERKEIVLYFSDRDGEYLIGEKRRIVKKADMKEEAKEVIIELIKGPSGKLTRTLPPKTKLLAIQLNEEGVAKVNFNKSLSKDHPGGSSAEIMTT